MAKDDTEMADEKMLNKTKLLGKYKPKSHDILS